jgi:hypothetical protein
MGENIRVAYTAGFTFCSKQHNPPDYIALFPSRRNARSRITPSLKGAKGGLLLRVGARPLWLKPLKQRFAYS